MAKCQIEPEDAIEMVRMAGPVSQEELADKLGVGTHAAGKAIARANTDELKIVLDETTPKYEIRNR